MSDRESRLDALRDEAARAGRVAGAGHPVAGGPIPPSSPLVGYADQPLLKPPVWTWEIPVYLFAGGVAGAAALLAFAAAHLGGDARTAADARWIAATGAAISPALLISDLGRPARFLNMLRVFKPQSAMSVGAWTLVLFSGAIFTSLGLHALTESAAVSTLATAADSLAALTGLVLATYTGVLLGVTTIPVWSAHARVLPIHFAASSLGAAASLIELVGARTSALNVIAIGAAAIETAIAIVFVLRRPADRFMAGPTGLVARATTMLTGPLPLALRLLASASLPARLIAASAAIAGSLLSRFAWMAAGRRSVKPAGSTNA